MKYCQNCGNKLDEVAKSSVWFCSTCQRHFYANPTPTVDAALFDDAGRILLTIRAIEPCIGKLNLPGGFMDVNETMEQAIARELKEELGLLPSDYSELIYAGSRSGIHVQESMERALISYVMAGKIKECKNLVADPGEIVGYLWKLPSELKPEDLTSCEEYDHIQAITRLFDSLG